MPIGLFYLDDLNVNISKSELIACPSLTYVSDLIDNIQLFKAEMWKSSLTPPCLQPSTFTWIPNTVMFLKYLLHLSYPLQYLMQNFSHLDYNAIISKLCSCFLFYSILLTIPRVVLIKAKPADPTRWFSTREVFQAIYYNLIWAMLFFFFLISPFYLTRIYPS